MTPDEAAAFYEDDEDPQPLFDALDAAPRDQRTGQPGRRDAAYTLTCPHCGPRDSHADVRHCERPGCIYRACGWDRECPVGFWVSQHIGQPEPPAAHCFWPQGCWTGQEREWLAAEVAADFAEHKEHE